MLNSKQIEYVKQCIIEEDGIQITQVIWAAHACTCVHALRREGPGRPCALPSRRRGADQTATPTPSCPQLFLHDPDQNMIEICNCDELPMILLESGVQLSAPSPVGSLEAPPALLLEMHSSGDHAASFDNLSDEESPPSCSSSCRSSSDSLYPPHGSPLALSEEDMAGPASLTAKGLDSRLSFDSHLLLSSMSLR